MKVSIFAMKINYWDYLAEYSTNRGNYLAIADKVFSSGRLILGEEVAAFEKNFASYCNSDYAVGLNSGTDALFIAMKALGIKAGDEVITVSNTAVPTVAAIRATGAIPVFADVEEDSFLIDLNDMATKITTRTKAILPVHLFGAVCDVDKIREIAGSKIDIIEDCAQSCGATLKGKKTGSLGDIAAFSFYPTKILGGFGDGGAVVTSDEALAKKVKRLRMYGMDSEYYSEEEGYNSRLDEIQAAILNFKLQSLDAALEKRKNIAICYDAILKNVEELLIPKQTANMQHGYYLYTIRCNKRDQLAASLHEKGIGAKVNYPYPIHLMRGYSFLGYKKGDLPVTEKLADSILSLPIYPELPLEQVEAAADAVRQFYR